MTKTFEIPIASSAAHFVQENEISKKSFFLEFEWLERPNCWVLHIADDQQNPIAYGIKLQPDWPLYVYQDGDSKIIFMLLPLGANTSLNRRTLYEKYTLVAHALV